MVTVGASRAPNREIRLLLIAGEIFPYWKKSFCLLRKKFFLIGKKVFAYCGRNFSLLEKKFLLIAEEIFPYWKKSFCLLMLVELGERAIFLPENEKAIAP